MSRFFKIAASRRNLRKPKQNMKQTADQYTSDFFDKLRRGRPRKLNAKSSAQRQAEYRMRQKALRQISVTRNEKS
jgi:hypothetical protein